MNEVKFTPGPWFAHQPINRKRMDFGVTAGKPYDPSRGALRRIAWVGNSSHLNPDLQGEVWANARLIAAAPDHALICWAMCIGAGRWEPFGDGSGEFCINGMRYSTNLDEFGCPIVSDLIRAAIARARGDQS